MQNFINFFGQTIKTQNAFYLPVGDGKVSFVDVRDIAAVATEILLAKIMRAKANNSTRTKNMILQVMRQYRIVKRRNSF